MVRVLTKKIKIFSKLPDRFIEEFNEVTNKSQIVWRKAKEKDNFKEFAPYLKKLLA